MKQMMKIEVKGVLTKLLFAAAVMLECNVVDGKTCGAAIDGEMKNGIRTFAIDMSLYGKADGSRRTEAEKAKYCAILTNFAYVVYEATDGLHRIGRIDVWVDNDDVKHRRDIMWFQTIKTKRNGAYVDVSQSSKEFSPVRFADNRSYSRPCSLR